MSANVPIPVRQANSGDLVGAGRLLHDFNAEFDEPAPPPEELAIRLGELIDGGDTIVLIAGESEPTGLAVLRFRKSIWTAGLDCHLAEFYVVPEFRGRGHGKAILGAVLDLSRERGVDYIDLGTSEDDVAARGLYESFGFRRTEGPDGPMMYVYEREL